MKLLDKKKLKKESKKTSSIFSKKFIENVKTEENIQTEENSKT